MRSTTTTTGTVLPYSFDATRAPRARIPSGSARTIPTGPVPARIVSASTLLLELDPRPDGITSTVPRTLSPACGWCRSVMVPSEGSTPPQNERGAESTRAGPVAVPATRALTSGIRPERRIAPHLPLHGRTHALGEAAEHDLDAEVPRRVVRPLAGVRHDHARFAPQDWGHVRARVRDDRDAGPLADLDPAPRLGLGQNAPPRRHVERHPVGYASSIEQADELLELRDREMRRPYADRVQVALGCRAQRVSLPGDPFHGHLDGSGRFGALECGLQGRRLRGDAYGVEQPHRARRSCGRAEGLEPILGGSGRQTIDHRY